MIEPKKNGAKTVRKIPSNAFKVGNPGGPGRPKGPDPLTILKKTLRKIGREYGKDFAEEYCRKAFNDDKIMMHVADRIFPKVSPDENGNVVLIQIVSYDRQPSAVTVNGTNGSSDNSHPG